MEELELLNGLEPVQKALQEFQKTYGEELWNMIFHRGEDPEDYLRAEVLWRKRWSGFRNWLDI